MASCSVQAKKKDRSVWLVGGTIEQITGSKLTSNKQALQRFFHLHSRDKKKHSGECNGDNKGNLCILGKS
jgi:hypothetical protein